MNNEKIEIIKSIINRGQKVKHFIIRYGLTEKEAFEIEAALIDFVGLDNLSNMVKGHSSGRGKISCDELDILLGAKKIEIQDDIMVIKINSHYRSDMNQEELYEATRKWWLAKKEKAEKVEYVLSVYNGIVRGVFRPNFWYKASDSNRIAFSGVLAPDFVITKYLHTSIEDFIVKGNANPIQYFFVDKENKKLIEVEELSSENSENEIKINEESLLIKINASYYSGMTKEEVYRATRGNWKLSIERAKKAKYVFDVVNGIIIEVFTPLTWSKIKNEGRVSFKGVVAPEEVRNKYINKSVRHLYLRGEVNPCKYQNV